MRPDVDYESGVAQLVRKTETSSSAPAVAPALKPMTSQGTPHGRFQRAIHRRHVQAAEMAAREMGGLSLADAFLLCELPANTDSTLDRGLV